MNDFRTLVGKDSKSICKGIHASPTVRMAYSLLFEDKQEEAEIRFQRILADEPDNPEALAGMAICMADLTGRYHAPTKLAKRAVMVDRKSVAGYFALSYLALKGSRLDDGYRYLMKAKRLAPADPRLAANLELYDRECPPVISDLSRVHPLNQFLGLARRRMRAAIIQVRGFVPMVEGLFRTGRLTN